MAKLVTRLVCGCLISATLYYGSNRVVLMVMAKLSIKLLCGCFLSGPLYDGCYRVLTIILVVLITYILCGCFVAETVRHKAHASQRSGNDRPQHRSDASVVTPLTTDAEQTSYHVFLSHRGPDTKHTVVDVLYRSFTSRGVTCFVDYEMEKGTAFPPTLWHAIRNSQVHIVVLSPSFAQSSWCLEEAAQIMDLQRSKPAGCSRKPPRVLPVFYGVRPDEVRRQRTGSAYDVSELHKKRSTADQRSRWSQALRDLADLTGIDWSQTKNKFEGKTIEEIVSRVESFVWESLQVYVDPKWESAYAKEVKQVGKMLQLERDIVSIGVHGPNRSEFATVLFNKFRRDFTSSCILLNVMEQARSGKGLLELQSRLFSGLVPQSTANRRSIIDNTGRGIVLLLDRLKFMKCFIVIDDVGDDEQQLKSLLVLDKHMLGSGSRLVLTSRYPDVLHNKAGVDEIISLPQTEASRKEMVVCYESKDVHAAFIDHLKETFSMLGLSALVVSREGLLKVARDEKPIMILVVLSRSFNADSPMLSSLHEASARTDAKIVYIFYGPQPGGSSSQVPMSSDQRPTLRRTISKNAFSFSVNFEEPTKPFNMAAFKTLVEDIMSKMRHDYKLAVTDFPVGLMKCQQEMENRILESVKKRNERQCFGIVGMGGIGKTTIAKSLYNKIHKKFEGSVFLLNIRAEAKAGSGLQLLQKAIINNVLGAEQGVNFGNLDEGKALLSSRLRGTTTLIILDDVDDRSQLEALFFPLKLGPGSVVIITSRDRRILKEDAKVNHVFEKDPLESEDARKLFYWHAFLKPFPPAALQGVAQQVIDACQGLPLSLQVIGAHVYNHVDPLFWRETLNHIKCAGQAIFEKLRVTVDVLEDYQKEAFLDICCFLIGKPRETALRVWDGCQMNAAICMYVLRSKCLVTLDPNDGTIGMHDQIRDMGRYIAGQRFPLRTHIWDAAKATDIPQDKLVLDGLRGFAWTSMDEDNAKCDADALKRLSGLKLFMLRNVRVVGNFQDLCYDELRWLQWQNNQFKFLPCGLWSRKLRVLDLSRSTQLEALWRNSDFFAVQVPDKLQELNLSGCKNLTELPPLNTFRSALEWFSLNGCERITSLDGSIGTLTNLKYLDLSHCKSLESLPDKMEGLCSLEKLLLSHCNLLSILPEDMGTCCSLIELYLDHTALSTLPESVCKLDCLEKLVLNNCPNLVSLPSAMGSLQMLRICNLRDCRRLEKLPDTFCELTNLEELDAGSCNIEGLPEGIGNLHKLRSLELHGNSRLRRLPASMADLRSLTFLNLDSCPLTDDGVPEELANLQSLEEVCMRRTHILEIPRSFAHLGKLSILNLHGCRNLQTAAFLPSSLRLVDMGHCPRLQRVGSLGEVKSLEHLLLCDCSELRELSGLDGPEDLLSLNVSGCSSLLSTAIASFGAGARVRRLQLSGSSVLPSKRLLQLPSLEHITVFGSQLPRPFSNCMVTTVVGVEHANELLMTVDIPTSVKPSFFAVVMCLVSHDQGWSDYPWEHGSYLQSPTLVEGVLVRDGWREGTVQLLYRNRHAEHRDQVHLVILRPECLLLQCAESGDKIEVRARSFYQAWRITVTQASYKVVTDGWEQLNALLEDISEGLMEAAFAEGQEAPRSVPRVLIPIFPRFLPVPPERPPRVCAACLSGFCIWSPSFSVILMVLLLPPKNKLKYIRTTYKPEHTCTHNISISFGFLVDQNWLPLQITNPIDFPDNSSSMIIEEID